MGAGPFCRRERPTHDRRHPLSCGPPPGRMKRTLAVVIVSAALVTGLSGCGGHHIAASSPKPCSVSRLHAQFWTTLPFNMSGVFSGLTITNEGGRCALPVQVSWAGVTDARGRIIAPAGYAVPERLPDATSEPGESPTARRPVPEFASMALDKSGTVSFASIYGAFAHAKTAVRPLVLPRAGKAELVLEIWTPVTDVHGCLSAPKGGAIDLGISNEALRASVPVLPAPTGGSFNLSGSGYWQCSTTLISPFLTWAQAAHLVGPPSGGQSLRTRDDFVYDPAP